MIDKPRKGSGTTRKTAGRAPAAKGAARSQAAPPSSPMQPSTVTDGTAPRTYASSPKVASRIGADERRRMIAEAAYFKAARRGFAPGNPDRDWAEAEAEIDAWLIAR
jgi:hypothetical protein